MPTKTATIIAKNVSSSVAAPFTRMMLPTERRSEMVVPKFPRMICPR